MATHLIIVNPTAGGGAALHVAPKATRLLEEGGLSFDVVHTERPWHAAELAHQAVKDGYQAVVALGGDGTVNEVLNGLMQAHQDNGGHRVALGVLCVGTGNDFAYGVGIPLDVEEGCAALLRGRTRPVDVGHAIGHRYFGNGIGIGFDAAVNVMASRLKWLRGFAVYLVSVLGTLLFYYRAPLTRIELDGQTLEQPTLMVSVMNGQRMGGGFLMAPNSLPDDGLFDLCIGAKMNQFQMLGFVPRFMRGTQAGQPRITMARSRRVLLTVKGGKHPFHADGELLSQDVERLELEILPGRLQVIC